MKNRLLGFAAVMPRAPAAMERENCQRERPLTISIALSRAKMLGAVSKEDSFAILDHFFEAGGNFIDTSNNYQDEQSEEWLGEWMERRGNRDQIVLATKFSSNFQSYKGFEGRQNPSFGGNSTKSLHLSVAASLKKLRTDYIDVLYIHWWDFTTSVPELMLSLNALLNQGKVLYLGASDLPAYVVAQANQYARDHGLRGFVVYQGRWSAAERDLERDVVPLSRADGLAIAPWGALGGGAFKTEAQLEELKKGGEGRAMAVARGIGDEKIAVSRALEKVAKRHRSDGSLHLTSIALAYIMQKAPNVFPIVGGRKVEQLKANIDALTIELSEEDVKEIEAAAVFNPGFPQNFLGTHASHNFLMNASGTYDYHPDQPAIKPKKHDAPTA